jgi:hypothetical protein
MENGLVIDDFPINTSIYKGFSMAMLNNQMVITVDGRTYETSHIWMICPFFTYDFNGGFPVGKLLVYWRVSMGDGGDVFWDPHLTHTPKKEDGFRMV